MKKIIAAAVATAFVAPAFAADVAVTGYVEYALVNSHDDSNGGQDKKRDSMNDESYFVIKASEELPNGMTVAADFVMKNDGEYTGNSLTISRADFGSIDIGDTSGAIDSIDDKADVFFVHDNGSGITSYDAVFGWNLPTIVENLSVTLTHSPDDEGTSDDTVFDVDHFSGDTQTARGSNGYALRYTYGDLKVGYASETVESDNDTTASTDDDLDNTLWNVTYSYAGFNFAYEVAKVEDKSAAASVDTESTAYAVTYAMGDTTLKTGGYEQDVTSDAAAPTRDITAYGIEHKIGALSLFIEVADDSATKDDMTAFGAKYSF